LIILQSVVLNPKSTNNMNVNNLIIKSSQYNKIDEHENNEFNNFNVIEIENIDYLAIDDWMVKYIEDHFNKQSYKNIFIPLSFGKNLVEFLGLRLALHIRTQDKNKNQFANIFLYGTESFGLLINHEYFAVLKTKGVKLIDYSLHSIMEHSKNTYKQLSENNLQNELEKINLFLPLHLYDNHSIANIWGMYRLLELDGLNPDDIESLQKNKKNSLNNVYLKLLIAKQPKRQIASERIEGARLRYSEKLKGPNIIGKI